MDKASSKSPNSNNRQGGKENQTKAASSNIDTSSANYSD
jgi:hypothetical protein